MQRDILTELERIIQQRTSSTADKSYTRQLLDDGMERCAKKLGEEAAETIIAALVQDDEALKGEAADLLYHLLVVLRARNIELSEVLDVLAKRMNISGLEEKAGRSGS